MANETSKDSVFTNSERLSIPIKIGWSVVLIAFSNILLIGFLCISISESMQEVNTSGIEWLGFAILTIVLLVVDILSIPQIFTHYIRFEDNHLRIALGLHNAKLKYSDMIMVAEKFSGIAFPWNPTAPGGVRIYGRTFDEVVAVADKDRFYTELLKRSPNIIIERS